METPNRLPIAEQIFGHNKAPLADVLAADFAELFADADKLADKAKARPAKIKDEADFAATGALANEVRAFTKRLDDARKAETDPLRTAGIEIKAAFDVLIDKLNAAFAPHQDAANSYVREKDARERREREEAARKIREQEERERQKAETASGQTAARAEGRAEALAAQADKLEQGGGSAADAVRTKISGGGVATARQGWDFSVPDYGALDLNELRTVLPRADIDKAIRSIVRIQKGDTNLKGVKVFPATSASFR